MIYSVHIWVIHCQHDLQLVAVSTAVQDIHLNGEHNQNKTSLLGHTSHTLWWSQWTEVKHCGQFSSACLFRSVSVNKTHTHTHTHTHTQSYIWGYQFAICVTFSISLFVSFFTSTTFLTHTPSPLSPTPPSFSISIYIYIHIHTNGLKYI